MVKTIVTAKSISSRSVRFVSVQTPYDMSITSGTRCIIRVVIVGRCAKPKWDSIPESVVEMPVATAAVSETLSVAMTVITTMTTLGTMVSLPDFGYRQC